MGGCYSKLDKKNAEARNSRLPAPGGPGVKAGPPLTPSSSSTALAPSRRGEPTPRPASGVSFRSRLFGPRTSAPADTKRTSSLIPRRGSADQRNNNNTNNSSAGSTNSISRRASTASNGATGRPPVRSPSGASLSSAGGRSTSRLPAPGAVAAAAKSPAKSPGKSPIKTDANANPSPKVEKATRPARSRSGNREHPYSRQAGGGGGKASDGEGAPPSTNLAVQELQRLATDDTYKAFKVRRRRYISAPRSCYDNYNAENYTKRLSSETATSAGSSDSDRTLMSAGSSERQKSATDVTPSPSLTDTSPFPKEEEVKDVRVTADLTSPENVPASSAAAATTSQSAAPAPKAAQTSSVDGRPTNNPERASLAVSGGLDRAISPGVTEARSPCGSQPLSIDSSADPARPSALSVSSLNSDDLMLTTDVGLDLEDDDIIKDIDDTEKEDPFLVANALATASGRGARRGAVESGGGAVRSPPSPRGAAGSNLTTPETISSAMSLVRQATGPAAVNPVMTTSMPGRLPVSPKPSLLRKKSMPASATTDAAKSAVLRRFRAQSNVERPRSFSSPLRPPIRSRLTSASSVTGQPGAADGAASDELPVLLCQSDYRHLTQDMKSVKLLLLRLKGMLLEDEGHQPPFLEQLNSFGAPNNNLCTSTSSIKRSDSASEPSTPLTADPFSPSTEDPPLDLETASREALVQEVLMMRRNTVYLRAKLAEREQTVKLLQQQMTKYVCTGPNETPSSTEQLRSFARHNFAGKFALDGGPSGGTEPPSPVVDPPCPPQASASASSLPNGDAIGLSPRPASRLRHGAARRDRDNGQPLRPSFLPVNPQSKRTLSTGHLPHRKSNAVMSTSAQL